MDIIFSLSISFVLGLVLATVYRWTHQSFSYARSFLHTMVLATIVITIMIMANMFEVFINRHRAIDLFSFTFCCINNI